MQKEETTLDNVFRYVNDKASEEYTFSSVKNVADAFGISTGKSRDLLKNLVADRLLKVVYENKQIKVYAPRELIENIVKVRKKPHWINKYPLPNKKQHLELKMKLDRELFEYEKFEELLYLKTKSLEESVIFAFKWLGFNVTPTNEGAYADLELNKDNFVAAVEVSGGNGGCPMDKIRQLSHYYTKTLEEEDRDIKHLIVLFNHFYDRDLEEREEPFAHQVQKAARRYKITLVTTMQLYDKIKRVKSGESKEKIVKEIIEGKWN
jgi:hypothetical protein